MLLEYVHPVSLLIEKLDPRTQKETQSTWTMQEYSSHEMLAATRSFQSNNAKEREDRPNLQIYFRLTTRRMYSIGADPARSFLLLKF
jgi:hypothetical protein